MSEVADTTWQGTKSVYHVTKDIVNPNPDIQTDRYPFENPNEEKLARLFTPVDDPLGSLARFLEDQDQYPDLEWMQLLFVRYPWVHSLIIVDKDGWMLDRMPYDPIKRISKPLVYNAAWRETFLQTRLDQPELGPELYVGTPWFQDAEFKGLIIASFDPRVLFSFCPDPDQLVILQPGGGVWTQDPNVDTAALLGLPWEEMIEDQVTGQVEAGGRYYTWLVRFVGHDPYIYLTESPDPQYSDSWLF